MMITKNDNHCDNDDNNNNADNGDNDKLSVLSPHKGPIMLSFDVTFVESKNNSRVSSDLSRHVPHVTSLWCDVFTQHRHICIVESGYEYINSYMSTCIQNCVRCNWLWCFGNTAIQSAVGSPKKDHLFCVLMFSLLLAWANIWNYSLVAGVEKTVMCYFVYMFIKIQSSRTNSKIPKKKITTITTWWTFRYDGMFYHQVCRKSSKT